MGKEKDEIFNRLRTLETSKASSDEKINNILTIVKEFTNDFKQHDEREMAKYEKYDQHVQELDKTLQNVVTGLNAVQKGHEDQDKKHETHSSELTKHKKETALEFKAINSKLNKGVGAILAFVTIAGIVIFVVDLYQKKLDKEEIKNQIMQEKLHKLDALQNRNYGYITGKEHMEAKQ